MKSNWAEISLCGGFFIIYFIDEFIHYFFGEAIQHSHGNDSNHTHDTTSSHATSRHNYGSLHNSESEPLLSASNNTHSQ